MKSMATQTSEGYLTKKDVAELLQLQSRTVDRYMRAGLPHLKLGSRRVRFKREDVIDWVDRKFRTVRSGNIATA